MTPVRSHPAVRPGSKDRPHVALIVETSLAPGREILRGIARYTRAFGPWSTFLEPRSLEEVVPNWLESWRGHGIIARVQNLQIARAVLAAGIPVVDVLGVVRIPGMPVIHTDDTRIAELAAEHLLERGFRQFAFFGLAGENWSQLRRDAFERYVRPQARFWTSYETPREVHHTKQWEVYADDLAAWIAGLPKPTALMLCSDQVGPAVLEACRRAGVDVPDEVAVIGVDDDEPLCEVAEPGLSSVWPDHDKVGYEAAALLDQLMRGGDPPAEPTRVPPRGVVTRRSSDVLALDDREAAAAVRMIREHACDPDGLTVDQVAAGVAVSRSVLERRFKAATGRTVHDEMVRVRLTRAKELLAETDLPLITIAQRLGFKHQEYMGAVFRKHLGLTPAQYRRSNKR